MYSIGELSQQTGISTQTIRYYEQINLLPQPERADNGYRIYGKMDVERLQFVQRARQLDFALDDIAEILALREHGKAPCRYVMDVMQSQITEIEQRMADLGRLRDDLVALHKTGLTMPHDVEMKACICHLLQSGTSSKEGNNATRS